MKSYRCRIKFNLMIIAGMLVIFAAGCSGAAAGAPQPPLGVYTNPLTTHLSAELTLLHGGRYTLNFKDLHFGTQGTWTSSGDQIVFTETGGGDCTGEQGTYKWVWDGKALTFTSVQDRCFERTDDFQSGPWTKQP